MLVGVLIGPTLAGWLVEVASWHWIFLINLPVGLEGLFAVQRFIPNFRTADAGRFDTGGYALLVVVAMVATSLALDGLSCLDWAHALRSPAPIFAPVLFAVQSFRVGLLGNLFARMGSAAIFWQLRPDEPRDAPAGAVADVA